MQQLEAHQFGQRLLNAELAAFKTDLEHLDLVRLAAYLEDTHLTTVDELLNEIGLGNRLAVLVARRLVDNGTLETKAAELPYQLAIQRQRGDGGQLCAMLPPDSG